MILLVVKPLSWLFVAGCRNMSRMSSVFHFLLFATSFDFDLLAWVLATLTPVGCNRRGISLAKVKVHSKRFSPVLHIDPITECL